MRNRIHRGEDGGGESWPNSCLELYFACMHASMWVGKYKCMNNEVAILFGVRNQRRRTLCMCMYRTTDEVEHMMYVTVSPCVLRVRTYGGGRLVLGAVPAVLVRFFDRTLTVRRGNSSGAVAAHRMLYKWIDHVMAWVVGDPPTRCRVAWSESTP